MATTFASLNDVERRVYEAMKTFADAKGYCRANQRELVAATKVAFTTLAAARDALVHHGFVERIKYLYRGKRDWYRVMPIDAVERAAEAAAREVRRITTVTKAVEDSARLLELPLS